MELDKNYHDLYLILNKKKSFLLAEKALHKAILLNENAIYYYELAQLLKRQGKWWQVVDNLSQALKLNSSNSVKWRLAYIDALEKMNRFQEVIGVFESLDKKEMNSDEYFRYACALEKEGDENRAEKAFLKAIELDDKYDSTVLGKGIFYEKKGLWIDSLRCYREEASREPFNALLHYKLGLSYDRNYEWEKAQEFISYAITLDNSKLYFFNRLAFNYERNGQFYEASEIYTLAIHKQKTDKPDLYYRLGYTLAKSNLFKESCEAFLSMNKIAIDEKDRYSEIEQNIREKSKVELVPKLNSLLMNINDLTFKEELKKVIKLGERIEAWEIVEECYNEIILRDENDDLNNYFSLGYALYKQEKYKEASHSFMKYRIFQDAHGVPEKKFDTDKGFNRAVMYAEYLRKEELFSKTILYQVDDSLDEECESYKLFLWLVSDERFKDWKHIWVIPEKREKLEEYRAMNNVIFVAKETNLYLKYLSSVEYLVNSGTFPIYFIRQKQQKYLTFWNKTLEYEIEETVKEQSSKTQNFLHATHIVSENSQSRAFFLEHYNIQNIYTGKIAEKEEGLSREEMIDFFFFDKIEPEHLIKEKKEKHSLLFFAPFERNGMGSSILNLLNMIDLEKYSITMILTSDDDVGKIDKLDKRINIITRFGRMVVTLEEQWIRDKLALYKILESEEMLSLYKRTFLREFTRLFGYYQFDTIIDFNGYKTFWTSLFAFGNAQYRTIYLHSDMYKEHQLKFPSLAITFNLYKRFDKLISVSESAFESNKASLAQRYNLLEEKFVFCNNPIDSKRYELLANKKLDMIGYKRFMEDRRKKFINVGRLSPEKGQLKLIEAFSALIQRGYNSVLYILGDGAFKAKLMNKIKEYQMEEHIFLLGYQENPYPFIKHSDCMVLTSEHEGQSLVLLEALALGTTAISTNIPGPRTVLKDGYGILSEENVEAITQSMENFLSKKVNLKHFDVLTYNKEAIEMFYVQHNKIEILPKKDTL